MAPTKILEKFTITHTELSTASISNQLTFDRSTNSHDSRVHQLTTVSASEAALHTLVLSYHNAMLMILFPLVFIPFLIIPLSPLVN